MTLICVAVALPLWVVRHMDRRYFNIGIYMAVFIALVDQMSKSLFLAKGFDATPFYKVNAFLNLRLSWNKGVTFGMLNDFGPWMPFILIGIAVVIVLVLLNWLRQARTVYAALGLGLVIGGAAGNVLDRLRFGAVVDFIDVHYQDYHWYTFNLADSAIVTGVGLLLLESFILTRHKR